MTQADPRMDAMVSHLAADDRILAAALEEELRAFDASMHQVLSLWVARKSVFENRLFAQPQRVMALTAAVKAAYGENWRWWVGGT